jgi:S1-C subfamily serine protease
MSDIERANGHRVSGVLPSLGSGPLPATRPHPKDYSFDLSAVLDAVRPIRSAVPADGHTAATLGTEREGNAVLIDSDGLLLTIGYLIVEATDVIVSDRKGMPVPAQVVGYDHETGFGLVRAARSLDIEPLTISQDVASLETGDEIVIAAQGGLDQAMRGRVAARREFAGSWEYLLEAAIFTVPLHPHWSGAALIDPKTGHLFGTGSLFVQEALGGDEQAPGNMFVPIDLLTPILDDLIALGRPARKPRPWLGMHTTEAMGHLLVAGVHSGGPAENAGVEPGDIIQRVDGQQVRGLSDLYRKMWSAGESGTEIRLAVVRGMEALEIVVRSGDRHRYLKLPQRH